MCKTDKLKIGVYIGVTFAFLLGVVALAFAAEFDVSAWLNLIFIFCMLVISADLLLPFSVSFKPARIYLFAGFISRTAAMILSALCCALFSGNLTFALIAIGFTVIPIVTDTLALLRVRKKYVLTREMEWQELGIVLDSDIDNVLKVRAAKRFTLPILYYLAAGFVLLFAVSLSLNNLLLDLKKESTAVIAVTGVVSAFLIFQNMRLVIKRALNFYSGSKSSARYLILRETVILAMFWGVAIFNFILSITRSSQYIPAMLIDLLLITHVIGMSVYMRSRYSLIKDKMAMFRSAARPGDSTSMRYQDPD